MTLVAIDSIDVGERFRRDMGDLPALAASIDRVGLLHPIVVAEQDGRVVLVAGERRLRACRDILRWERIPIRMLPPIESLLEAERDENEVRLDFAPSEAVAIAAAIRPKVEAEARDRQGTRTDLAPEEPPAIVARSSGDSRDRIAAAVGMGRTTLARAEAVVEAAAENPVLAPLVEVMDETGRVAPVHAALQALPSDPEPEQVRAAVEQVRERRTTELLRAAGERLAEAPEVREKDRALRFAKAMKRHSEAQYDLAAEHWRDGLDRSDIDAMRGLLVVARRWLETWEQTLEGTSGLRIVGGSK